MPEPNHPFDTAQWARRAGDAKVRVVHLQQSWAGQPSIVRVFLGLVGLILGIGLALLILVPVLVLGVLGGAILLAVVAARRVLHRFTGERQRLDQPRRRNVRVVTKRPP